MTKELDLAKPLQLVNGPPLKVSYKSHDGRIHGFFLLQTGDVCYGIWNSDGTHALEYPYTPDLMNVKAKGYFIIRANSFCYPTEIEARAMLSSYKGEEGYKIISGEEV